MHSLSNAIREKQDWQKKRLDPTITTKWKEEIQAQEESVTIPPEHRLSDDMVSKLGAAVKESSTDSTVNADRLCSG